MRLSAFLSSIVAVTLAAQSPKIVTTHSDRQSLRLTLYQGGKAFVQESRAVALPKGSCTLWVEDLSSHLTPESFQIRNRDLELIPGVSRQSYIFSRPTAQNLLSRYEGKRVQIASQKRGGEILEEATLLSTEGDNLVLKFADRLEVMSASTPKRILLPGLPMDIPAKPHVEIAMQNLGYPQGGFILTYLTSNFHWSPTYAIVIKPGETKIDLTACARIVNLTQTPFLHANVDVLAGDVPIQAQYAYVDLAQMSVDPHNPPPPPPPPPPRTAAFLRQDMPHSVFAGERQVYALPTPLDLLPNQEIQAPFLEVQDIPIQKEYRLFRSLVDEDEDLTDPEGQSVPVIAELLFKNESSQKLGRQLPAGTVRLHQVDASGVMRFLGEQQVNESAAGAEVRLGLGSVSDLTAKWKLVDHKVNESTTPKRSDEERALEIRFSNRKDRTETIHIQVEVQGDWILLSSSIPGTKEQAHTLGFQVPVPAKGQTKLQFRVRSKVPR